MTNFMMSMCALILPFTTNFILSVVSTANNTIIYRKTVLITVKHMFILQLSTSQFSSFCNSAWNMKCTIYDGEGIGAMIFFMIFLNSMKREKGGSGWTCWWLNPWKTQARRQRLSIFSPELQLEKGNILNYI